MEKEYNRMGVPTSQTWRISSANSKASPLEISLKVPVQAMQFLPLNHRCSYKS